MRKGLCLLIALVLVSAALVACVDRSESTPEVTESAPTAVPTSTPAVVPTPTPTSTPAPTATTVPTPNPTPTAQPIPTAPPAPTPEPTIVERLKKERRGVRVRNRKAGRHADFRHHLRTPHLQPRHFHRRLFVGRFGLSLRGTDTDLVAERRGGTATR